VLFCIERNIEGTVRFYERALRRGSAGREEALSAKAFLEGHGPGRHSSTGIHGLAQQCLAPMVTNLPPRRCAEG